jgi:hypothetical protein
MQPLGRDGIRFLKKTSLALATTITAVYDDSRATSLLLFIDETESLAGSKADWATVLDPHLSVSLFPLSATIPASNEAKAIAG